MRVLFWGTPHFAIPALRALSDEGHDVVGVVTQPDRPAGRGRGLTPSPVKEAAHREGVPVLQPERARGPEFTEQVQGLHPDVSVVVAYGQILRPEILELPVRGSINIHASLLPELRGAAPIHWAIIRGFETTGVSIMQMEAGLDSGPVLHQVGTPIGPEETTSDLSSRLAELGAEAMVETLAIMEAGMAAPVPQEHGRATYAPKVDRETGHLSWSAPALEVARWIRGLDSVPGAWSVVDGGNAVKLFGPTFVDASGAAGEVLEADGEAGLLVAAGDGALRIREVQPQGKRRMTASEWIRGRGIRAGARLS